MMAWILEKLKTFTTNRRARRINMNTKNARFALAIDAVTRALNVICDAYPPGMVKTPRIKAAAGRVKEAETRYLAGELPLSTFLATLDVWQAVVISEATKFLGEQAPVEVMTEPIVPEVQDRPPEIQENLI
jgi:hypothetical protein